jgi:hypothetical protein
VRKVYSGWHSAAISISLVTALTACRGWPAPRAVPATITQPTAASRAALERAVSQAFGGTPVRLATNALVHESLLIVGRTQSRDIEGVPLNGRELGRPQHFELLLRGTRCVLLHTETGRARVLSHTRCRMLPQRHGGG